MAKLKTQARNALPDKAFAGPNRSYPVEDKPHATAALRLLHNAPASEQPHIRARAQAVLGHIVKGLRAK
jgi:hypothetical protein